jgi:hypothetical protein
VLTLGALYNLIVCAIKHARCFLWLKAAIAGAYHIEVLSLVWWLYCFVAVQSLGACGDKLDRFANRHT